MNRALVFLDIFIQLILKSVYRFSFSIKTSSGIVRDLFAIVNDTLLIYAPGGRGKRSKRKAGDQVKLATIQTQKLIN